ncbi:hypothetical protein D3C74_358480 [compost metagenome]
MMNIELKSDYMESADYDEDIEFLRVHYKDGRLTTFYDVKKEVALKFSQSENQDKFYTEVIKKHKSSRT